MSKRTATRPAGSRRPFPSSVKVTDFRSSVRKCRGPSSRSTVHGSLAPDNRNTCAQPAFGSVPPYKTLRPHPVATRREESALVRHEVHDLAAARRRDPIPEPYQAGDCLRVILIAFMNSRFAFDDQPPTDCEAWRQLSP